MTDVKVRENITWLVLGGNLLVFACLTGLWIAGGFSTGEFKQTMLLLTPLLFAYATPILKHVFDTRLTEEDLDVPISRAAAVLGLIAPPVVTLLVLAFCLLKAFNLGLTSFEDFAVAVGAVQTVFGGYIGLVVSTFFRTRPA